MHGLILMLSCKIWRTQLDIVYSLFKGKVKLRVQIIGFCLTTFSTHCINLISSWVSHFLQFIHFSGIWCLLSMGCIQMHLVFLFKVKRGARNLEKVSLLFRFSRLRKRLWKLNWIFRKCGLILLQRKKARRSIGDLLHAVQFDGLLKLPCRVCCDDIIVSMLVILSLEASWYK